MVSSRSAIIYVTYDGLLEPLGQSQVVAYLEKLAPERPIHIVSFEKSKDRFDKARMAAMRARLAAAQIGWTPLAYHKSPIVPATAFDVAQGSLVVLWLALRFRAAILHARSYVPALIVLPAKWIAGAKFLFDIRGFWADERVDGGLWPKSGALYRGVKRMERLFIAEADYMVTLTHASAREFENWPVFAARNPPLAVIPTCADLDRFRLEPEPPMEPFVFGYVGSVGTWYLFDETVKLFLALARRRPEARMLIINRSEHETIREILARHGVSPDRFEIAAAEHRDVAKQIARMHAAAQGEHLAGFKVIAGEAVPAPQVAHRHAVRLGNGAQVVATLDPVAAGRRRGLGLRQGSLEHGLVRLQADQLLRLEVGQAVGQQLGLGGGHQQLLGAVHGHALLEGWVELDQLILVDVGERRDP